MPPNEPPSSTRVDRKKEETRQKILTAAMRLIGQHSFQAVTMEQIAEAADIAKGTLYHYYPVKEAILADSIDRESLERNAERIRRMAKLPDTRARLAASLKELIQAVRQRQELFEIYFTYRTQKMVSLKRQDAQVSGLQRLETEIIRLGREQGEISPDLPIEFLEALYEFTFIMVAQNFYRDPQRFDAESTIACCVDLFMDGAAQNRKD